MDNVRQIRSLERVLAVARIDEQVALSRLAHCRAQFQAADQRHRQLQSYAEEKRQERASDPSTHSIGGLSIAADFENTLDLAIQGAAAERERVEGVLTQLANAWRMTRLKTQAVQKRCEQARIRHRAALERAAQETMLNTAICADAAESEKPA